MKVFVVGLWTLLMLLLVVLVVVVITAWIVDSSYGHWGGCRESGGYTIRHYQGDGRYGGMGDRKHAHELVHDSNPDFNYVQWWGFVPGDSACANPVVRSSVAAVQVEVDECVVRLGGMDFEIPHGFSEHVRNERWDGWEAESFIECVNEMFPCSPKCFYVWVNEREFTDGSVSRGELPELFKIASLYFEDVVVEYETVSCAPGVQRNVALMWGALKQGGR